MRSTSQSTIITISVFVYHLGLAQRDRAGLDDEAITTGANKSGRPNCC